MNAGDIEHNGASALIAAALFLSACTSSTPRPAPCPQCNASETCVQVCVDDAGAVAPECVTKVSDGSYNDRAGKAVRDCSGF